MSEYGIDKIANAIQIVGETIKETIEAFEDKKINFLEAWAIIRKAIGFIGVVRDGKEIVLQFKDLDEAEREEIKKEFQEHFDIPDENVEVLVEKIFNWLLAGTEMIDEFKIVFHKQ